jgi:DNA-binding response OmpR family regulator
VLVVEDEPGLADVLAVHLAAAGYAPVVAHDGLEALYALEQWTPAVVLLDLHLPRVSGFRLLQLLRPGGAAPRVPVLVLTALSFGEAREALRAGADAFLTKPFRPADVVAQVARLLAGAGPAVPVAPGAAAAPARARA